MHFGYVAFKLLHGLNRSFAKLAFVNRHMTLLLMVFQKMEGGFFVKPLYRTDTKPRSPKSRKLRHEELLQCPSYPNVWSEYPTEGAWFSRKLRKGFWKPLIRV